MTTPEEIRRQADDILARPEYQEATPGLVERALDWLSRRLGELVTFGPPSSAVGGYIIGTVILAAALAVVVWIAWRIFPSGSGVRRGRGGVSHQSVPRASRAEWLARATEAEAGARWAEAVHARYHALTTGLADRAVLPAPESTTSGEHRAAFARRAAGDATGTGPGADRGTAPAPAPDPIRSRWRCSTA